MAQSRPKLNSSEIFAYAFKIAAEQAQDSPVTIVGESIPEAGEAKGAKNESYAAKFFCDGKKEVILLCSTSDTAEVTPWCAGARPFHESLQLVMHEQKKPGTKKSEPLFIIPLCEASPYSGFIPWAVSWLSWLTCGLIPPMPPVRQHWTLLVIQGDQCHFYDPKGTSSGWVYSLNPVEGMLRQKDFNLTEHYEGWQNWNNDTHCGYFVGTLIKREIVSFISGKKAKQTPSNVTSSIAQYDEISRNSSLEEKLTRFKENSIISQKLKGAEAQKTDYDGSDPDEEDTEMKKQNHISSERSQMIPAVKQGSSSPTRISKALSEQENEQKSEQERVQLNDLLGKNCVAVTSSNDLPTVVVINFRDKKSAEIFVSTYLRDDESCMRIEDTEVTVSISKKLNTTAIRYLLEKARPKRLEEKFKKSRLKMVAFSKGKKVIKPTVTTTKRVHFAP